jgi:hypothetical protein
MCALISVPAHAVPSFARQTGLQCQSCHVGAFGPQLTNVGREFKLNGYVMNDGKDPIPIAGMLQASFTHTGADQPGGAARDFSPNDNPAIDQVSLFYAGRITESMGAFVQVTYNGIAKQLAWDNLDIRYAQKYQLADKPLIAGLTINNNPTVQDLWNSTPAWGFPFESSSLAPTPLASTTIDGGLSQVVLGGGGYVLWNDLIYAEADIYKGLGRDIRNALGVTPVSGTNSVDGVIPYWRIALQHDFGDHYLELGSFGLSANIFPGGDQSTGRFDNVIDTAVDATYLYNGGGDHIVTGYVTYIHEHQTLDASTLLLGANAHDTLSTFRINGSYSYKNTYTLSAQRFETSGTADEALYGGSPNTAGWNLELAYVPSGKPGISLPYDFNARLSLQYTLYDKFDGARFRASDNNTLFLMLWLAH